MLRFQNGGKKSNVKPVEDFDLKTGLNLLWEGAKVLDPTGISSYGDVYDTFNDPNANWFDKTIAVTSALPLIGKVGKGAKLGKLAFRELSTLGKAKRIASGLVRPIETIVDNNRVATKILTQTSKLPLGKASGFLNAGNRYRRWDTLDNTMRNEEGVTPVQKYISNPFWNNIPEELKQYKEGGIPERYKNMGFTRVGQKKEGDGDKKWKVLAKKGDQYKVVQGGYRGMQDFSQHKDKDRQKAFWSRMGGKDSAKANDPFSPLYWHARLGTWKSGGQIPYSEDGLYEYPEQPVIVPTEDGSITMDDIDYPVMAFDNYTGEYLDTMQPNEEYEFDTDEVLEIPLFQKGGMVSGVANMISMVKDKDNRREIGNYIMRDFEKENVKYNKSKFRQLSNLQTGGSFLYNTGSSIMRDISSEIGENGYERPRPTDTNIEISDERTQMLNRKNRPFEDISIKSFNLKPERNNYSWMFPAAKSVFATIGKNKEEDRYNTGYLNDNLANPFSTIPINSNTNEYTNKGVAYMQDGGEIDEEEDELIEDEPEYRIEQGDEEEEDNSFQNLLISDGDDEYEQDEEYEKYILEQSTDGENKGILPGKNPNQETISGLSKFEVDDIDLLTYLSHQQGVAGINKIRSAAARGDKKAGFVGTANIDKHMFGTFAGFNNTPNVGKDFKGDTTPANFLNYWKGKFASNLQSVSNKQTVYDSFISKEASKYGIRPEVVKAVIQTESGFDPKQIAPNGRYKGMMQLSEEEFKANGGRNIFNPLENIAVGIKLLSEKRKRFQ